MKNFILIFVIVGMYLCGFTVGNIQAKHEKLEKDYQSEWCIEHKGTQEVTFKDADVRVDCVTSDYAVEFDFAESVKWAECVGQALRYSTLTGLPPACALIVEKEGDEKYAENIRAINKKFHTGIEIIFIKGY